MKTLPLLTALMVLALLEVPARADLPPGDSCNAEGAACDDANVTQGGQKGDPGTCTKSTCTRTLPSGPDGGAAMTMSYECLRCLASTDGGSGGAHHSGCALAARARPFGPWLLAGSFAALVSLRRRRR